MPCPVIALNLYMWPHWQETKSWEMPLPRKRMSKTQEVFWRRGDAHHSCPSFLYVAMIKLLDDKQLKRELTFVLHFMLQAHHCRQSHSSRHSGSIISTVKRRDAWMHTCLILCFLISYSNQSSKAKKWSCPSSVGLPTSIKVIETTPKLICSITEGDSLSI